MKKLIIIAVCWLSFVHHAMGAPMDEFITYTAYESKPGMWYTDDASYTYGPYDFNRRQLIMVGGVQHEVGRVMIHRISEVTGQFTLKVEALIYKTIKGSGLMTPISLFFDLNVKPWELTSENPCVTFRCRPFDIRIAKSYRPLQEGDLEGVANTDAIYIGVTEVISFGIKSVDYNWRTGEWKNLVLTQKTYHELRVLPTIDGGLTVGTMSPGDSLEGLGQAFSPE